VDAWTLQKALNTPVYYGELRMVLDTAIKISNAVKMKLNKLKKYERETYNEVIKRLINHG
jgi:hypothetical protein